MASGFPGAVLLNLVMNFSISWGTLVEGGASLWTLNFP